MDGFLNEHRPSLSDRYANVRRMTEALSEALTDEDQCIQSMADASPAKWHRAHTTWFFEEFVLRSGLPGYEPFSSEFGYLFNSYYEAVGPRHPRLQRGLITRPSAGDVSRYRAHVDRAMAELLDAGGGPLDALIELGLQHEQQHQELLLTDMLHAFAQNPLAPALAPGWSEPPRAPVAGGMRAFPGGIASIGAAGGFAFDSETPRHDALIQPFQMAVRLVSNRDFLNFIEDGGYRSASLWMSDGWDVVRAGKWECPLYWERRDGRWRQMGPGGMADLDPDAALRQVSWYEADAYARWAGARLPTEQEWEVAAADPAIAEQFGIVWQWTSSAFRPYPGYAPPPGAVGEYNGKFMMNQMVLRGGSVATPPGHSRLSYRNFFHPDKRWQFSGIRLAADL